jgi:hypothetical protein
MGYGSKSENIKEESPLSFGVHSGTLAGIVFGKTTPRDASKLSQDIVTIRFVTPKGGFIENVIYNPDTQTDEKKQEAAQEYVCNLFTYIASKVYRKAKTDKSILISSKVDSWEALRKDVEERIFKDNYTEVALRFKTVGNVWKERPSVQIPRNFVWLENLEAIKEKKALDVVVSDYDKSKNAEYQAIIDNPASSGKASAPTAGAEEAGDDLPF